MSVAIVVAARNEADNIAEIVDRANSYGCVLVVDNASENGTAELAESAGAAVFRHERDTHIKQSYFDGFKVAVRVGYDRIVQMDAGLSHDPDEIPLLLGGLDDHDMVIGSRFIEGAKCRQPFHRRVLSRGGSALVRAVTGMPYSDLTGGFKAYRRDVLLELPPLQARAHAFQFELTWHIHRRGWRIGEIPVSYVSGASSVGWRVVWEALRVAVSLRAS